MRLTAEIRARVEERCPAHRAQLESLVRHAQGDAVEFVQSVVQYGYLDRDTGGDIVSTAMGRTYVNLGKTLFQDEVVAKVPAEFAEKSRALPLYKLGNAATVAMVDPHDAKTLQALESFLGASVSPVFSFPDEVDSAILVKYRSAVDLTRLVTSFDFAPFKAQLTDARLAELVQSKQLVEMGDSLILLALKERASDIHIEPKKAELLVRFRIDGVLVDRMVFPAALGLPLASRLKVAAGMDITERRAPQDGRLRFQLPLQNIDIRISTLPMLHGEKVVMRILGTLFAGAMLSLERLDIVPGVLTRLKEVIRQPNGILFVTGPTGSGKTTTLYAALNFINRPGINVVTIEDPVEYELASINQVQVNERAGRSFHAVLRSVLRQDPDVILVGEIRDTETARIATQAAMTGHLVLTTLHTNDAIQASTRLIDMGVERFMVAPSLIGVLNQRLVRRVCDVCRVEYQPDPEYLAQFFTWRRGYTPPPFYRGEGCERCGGTGYHGRVGIHEFLNVTHRLRDALLQQTDYAGLRAIALAEGFHDMRFDGLKKALRGLTTIEEVVEATLGEVS
ncbi:MAG TPA: GspE/PulE family protein [Usitatibacter sp.]|jgi:type IV pilus assembly protein PilB